MLPMCRSFLARPVSRLQCANSSTILLPHRQLTHFNRFGSTTPPSAGRFLTAGADTAAVTHIMALTAAYANLQLDPDDRPRTAAFEAFCWQHILEHASPRWIAEVRGGKIRLQQRTRVSSSGKSCSVYNDCGDDMVFSFVTVYAKLVWPLDDDSREHLTSAKRLGSYVGEIYATLDSLTITHKKEVEMRECNVPATAETSTVESVIGCRVRSCLTQLLVSDHPVPASQSFDTADLLQQFLDISQQTSPIGQHRQHFSGSIIGTVQEPSSIRKRRRVDSVAPLCVHVSPRRDAGLVRLRFTYSGTRRLQGISFCPSRPTAVLQRKQRAGTALADSINGDSSSVIYSRQQCASITGKYQCWLRNCSDIFKTTEDIVDHVQRQHSAKYRQRMEVAISSAAPTDTQPQQIARVSGTSRGAASSTVESLYSLTSRENLHASLMKSQQASQDLQDAVRTAMMLDSKFAERSAGVP